MIEDILNIVRREAERVVARNSPWAIGTLSSYDKDTHSGKVQLQPEDTQTGWLPILSLSVGSGFGLSIGPTLNTSCLIHFQDGSREAGSILGFFFSDAEKPVSVEEGEIVLKTSFGSALSMKKDGSILMIDKSGASFGLDGSGNITFTGKSGAGISIDANGNLILSPAGTGHVMLGGPGAVQPAAKNGDAVTGGLVVATSTKVKVL